MYMMTLWERATAKRLAKLTGLLVLVLALLYALLDWASHDRSTSWSALLGLQAAQLILRLDLLIPFSLCIAATRLLAELARRGELAALQASGVTPRRLLRPFFAVALLAASLLYLNGQLVAPAAARLTRAIAGEQRREGEAKRPAIGRVPLKDGSLLLYARYDGSMHDCYWIRSSNQLYHCGRLDPHANPVVAYQVDHLVRHKGVWTKAESVERTLLPMVRVDPAQLEQALTAPDLLSTGELALRWWEQLRLPLAQRGPIASWLYTRLLLPLLCLVAVLVPAPWCLRRQRQVALLLPLAVSLSLLLCLWAFLDAALMISTQQLLAPEWSLGTVALLIVGVLLLLRSRIWSHSN
jgi:lipopolysaccharide export system permease protein